MPALNRHLALALGQLSNVAASLRQGGHGRAEDAVLALAQVIEHGEAYAPQLRAAVEALVPSPPPPPHKKTDTIIQLTIRVEAPQEWDVQQSLDARKALGHMRCTMEDTALLYVTENGPSGLCCSVEES